MAKWWPFGRKKEERPAPAPEPTPAPPPRPEPAPAPAEEAPKKRGGLLGRLFGRKKKEEEAPPQDVTPPPPSAPSAEEAPPEAPPAAPPEVPPGAPPGERVYPSHLHVDAEGEWHISDTVWEGTMSGTLHGADVKKFIDAMEADPPDHETAIPLIGDAYGIPGGLIRVGHSHIYSIHW
ncbi:hypothetical protein CFC35_41980 [Streptomyces sp. FBKL.4005]|uniref:hypothetical protein n=1 Tax=Streptomyces sp. FBKL.4005 TaxID=2015515 RepID=UPI000B9656D6|nr:hypothetical protein [Streptomyces sp. FBKL.4005]OYP09988.1 hypothetical protein CFC35_41980 [Streptomyces sp. FBKL.4005]